ncbi:MAG: hypothetical protein DHS20C08_10630 [Rhodomicrobium sp.]|jgi:hypothetical protein|nr:MAG: hypothetical protein DHS20C08_10630 [Rhodomicrobium sp.]
MKPDLQNAWSSFVKTTAMGVVFAILTMGSINAASANPFKKVAGKWRSAGATAIIKGKKERIKCRASYSTPGRSLIMSLKCSGPGYFVNVSVDARVIGSKVKGSWSESQFGKSGWLSGRASSKSSNLSFGGSSTKGSMSLRLSSRSRHSIYIRSNGNRVSIPLRR